MGRRPLLAAALLAASLVSLRLLLFVARVEGTSMEPTYSDGDRVLCRRWLRASNPRTGQIVVGRLTGSSPDSFDGVRWIKRVEGVRGGPRDGAVHVKGDGPDSADSRVWGWTDLRDIEGVAIGRLAHR